MSGFGFGTFCPRVSLKRIKYLLPHFLAKSLFGQYNPDDRIKLSGLEIIKKQDRALDFDSVKQILSASLLSSTIYSHNAESLPLLEMDMGL